MNQDISQQELEELLAKVKFITFGIIGNIKWNKVKPLKFLKNEDGKESARLMFEIEEARCSIQYKISEKNKQEFLKMSAYEIVENFIWQHLVNYGKNGYYDDKCLKCKQTTLTKSLNEKGICCNLCGWAMSMKVYQEYSNDKKHLEFYEWLRERNRRMVRTRA